MNTGFRRNTLAVIREKSITLACRVLAFLFDLFGGRPPALKNWPSNARFLIIKPCCLGDVVLATPVVAALAETLPRAKLEFAVGNWSRPVLEGNPALSAIISTGTDGSVFTLRQYLDFVRRLRREKYFAILVLDRSPLLNLIPWLAGAKIRAGLDSLGRGFALNIRARVAPPHYQIPDLPVRHEADTYLMVVQALGLNPTNPGSHYYPPATAQSKMQEKSGKLGLDLTRPFAVIHPGGGNNPDTSVPSKRWPARKFAEIASRLTRQGLQVVLIGAPDRGDRVLADEVIANFSGEQTRLLDAVGQFNIAETGALFEKARLFVGNDTGLMHLASACGTAVVAVFGPSSPVIYGPYTPLGRAVASLAGSALEGIPLTEYEKLTAAQGGIDSVTVEQVWEAIAALLPELINAD